MGCQVHQQYSDEYVRLIGIVAIESAFLDALIVQAVLKLAGLAKANKGTPIAKQASGRKLKTLSELENIPDELKPVLDDLKEIYSDRNFSIHGITIFESEKLAGKRKHVTFREKNNEAEPPPTEESLKSLIARMAAVAKAILDCPALDVKVRA